MTHQRANCECGRLIIAWRSKGIGGIKSPSQDHDLCQKCWKAQRDRNRQKLEPEMSND